MKTTILVLLTAVLITGVGAAAQKPRAAYAQTQVVSEQCDGNVAIVPNDDDPPDAPNAMVLRRDDPDAYEWLQIPGNGKTVRWYCKDNNFWRKFDLREWHFTSVYIDAKCAQTGDNCIISFNVGVGTGAVNGWYPETSHCSRESVKFARLDSNQGFEVRCT